MTVLKNNGAVSTQQSWHSINWDRAHMEVMKLQVRIAKATKQGRWNKVKALQWLLTHSHYAKCLAVRRVVTNRGKKTPGVDGVVLKSAKDKYRMILSLNRRNYRPQPLRRIYIPKAGGKKHRPLGIPTMRDRLCRHYTLLPSLLYQRHWRIVIVMASDWKDRPLTPSNAYTEVYVGKLIHNGYWKGTLRGASTASAMNGC